MKYEIKPSSKFKKGLKAAAKRGRDLNKLTEVIKRLADADLILYLLAAGSHSDLFHL